MYMSVLPKWLSGKESTEIQPASPESWIHWDVCIFLSYGFLWISDEELISWIIW